jgi:hypothetical protein
VAGRHILTIAFLGGVLIAATAAGRNAPAPLYSLAATRACLMSPADAIDGLPPAIPPSPPARFVSVLPRYRLPRAASGQLGVFYGHRKRGAYAGAILTFFKSEAAARAYVRLVARLFTPTRVRNVTVEWGYAKVSEPGWRDAVRGCLRAGPRATQPPKRPVPRASLRAFAGYWGGHTRGLRISADGRGVEYADDGCCVRVYRSTFQILTVSGTLTRATARYRVISSKRYEEYAPRLQVGQVGKLVLQDGIVKNALTRDFFCSDPAWWATEACGA